MKWNKIFIAVAVTVFFISCKKSEPTSDITIEAKTLLNVAYGTDPLQKMDIYLPANRSITSTQIRAPELRTGTSIKCAHEATGLTNVYHTVLHNRRDAFG